MVTVDKPDKHISKDAIKVWRMTNIIGQVTTILICAGLIGAGFLFDWLNWVKVLLVILLIIDVLLSIWVIFFEPVLLQRYWLYHIDEEFIQTQHGIFKTKYTTVPMTKVQYVTVEQGPLLRKYGLSTLEIGTMRSSISIPALPEEEALTLRSQVAEDAKVREVGDV